jgi:hypothetical protein
MSDPSTAPDNELDYAVHSSEVINERDMEALAANAEQGADMDQVIRHNLYIGWVMGLLRDKDVTEIRHGGGNRMDISTDRYTVMVVVPYPPRDWKP